MIGNVSSILKIRVSYVPGLLRVFKSQPTFLVYVLLCLITCIESIDAAQFLLLSSELYLSVYYLCCIQYDLNSNT